jgi:hypothetical protein
MEGKSCRTAETDAVIRVEKVNKVLPELKVKTF